MKARTRKRRKTGSAGKERQPIKKAAVAIGAPVRTKANGTDEPRFARVADALSKNPGVTFNEGKGFGSRALKVNGKIFAMMTSKNEYVVKLSKERVQALVLEGIGDYFDAGKGKPMKEWLSIHGFPKESIDLAREAYQFVSGR